MKKRPIKEIRYGMIKVTKKEIEEIKKEYLEEHTYIGTDTPVILNDMSAEHIVRSKKFHEAWKDNVHSSHEMGDWFTDIRAPVGTPRFYGCQECKKCGAEHIYHSAGRFKDKELLYPCEGELKCQKNLTL